MGRHRYLVAPRAEPAVEEPAGLTPRERQVIGYAALGRPNKLIAYDLGLTASTVASHVARACRKLGIRTRRELIRKLRRGAGGPVDPFAALTASEREVLTLVLAGRSNREIAGQRGKSERTIANQLASIMGKLGTGSRFELIARYG